MFGMLDYRAYKLLWLICMPLRWLIWVAAWASIVIAIMFSASLDYSVPVRIAIAYAIWEGSGIVLTIIRAILFWFIKKGFFWLVDVVPAKADSTGISQWCVTLTHHFGVRAGGVQARINCAGVVQW